MHESKPFTAGPADTSAALPRHLHPAETSAPPKAAVEFATKTATGKSAAPRTGPKHKPAIGTSATRSAGLFAKHVRFPSARATGSPKLNKCPVQSAKNLSAIPEAGNGIPAAAVAIISQVAVK